MMRELLTSLVLVALCFSTGTVGADDSPAEPTGEPSVQEVQRVSVEVAKDRARLLEQVYLTTLDVIHHKYFHGDRAVVPARAMEDVFQQLQQTSHMEAKWIAVSLKAMSIDHEPETAFEKEAAREIKQGAPEVELVEDGYYRRAVAVSMTGGCLHCHDGFAKTNSTTAKFAGLVISIPVHEGAVLPQVPSASP